MSVEERLAAYPSGDSCGHEHARTIGSAQRNLASDDSKNTEETETGVVDQRINPPKARDAGIDRCLDTCAILHVTSSRVNSTLPSGRRSMTKR